MNGFLTCWIRRVLLFAIPSTATPLCLFIMKTAAFTAVTTASHFPPGSGRMLQQGLFGVGHVRGFYAWQDHGRTFPVGRMSCSRMATKMNPSLSGDMAMIIGPWTRRRFCILSSSPSSDKEYDASSMVPRDRIRIVTNPDLISSVQSATVKRIKALLQKRKTRMEKGQTVVEGPRIILDLLGNPQTQHLLDTILVEEGKEDEFLSEIQNICDTTRSVKASSCTIHTVTPLVLATCSDTVTPQGIVAVARIPHWELPKPNQRDSSISTENDPTSMLYLILDGVSDPGNVGTLLRTAVATGVAGVILLPGCCDVWNPKAIRSAMTATFLVPISTAASWTEALEQMNQRGVENVWAATMMTSDQDDNNKNDNTSRACTSVVRPSLPHYDVDWCKGPAALVIGSEGSGLSLEIRDSLQHASESPLMQIRAVHLPMRPGIESLNAAICGSVILFEYLRQQDQKEASSVKS